jgi:secreted Zn-dependent insulinase-like peptidase
MYTVAENAQKPQTLIQAFDRYLLEITNQTYHFNKSQEMIANADNVELSDMISFVEARINIWT